MKHTIITVWERFTVRRLGAASLMFVVAGCAETGEPKPVYVTPNLPSDQLATVFIEDDTDNFIFVELDAVGNIEAVDGLVVDTKEVRIPPGRHRLDIEVHYPSRGFNDFVAFIAGIALLAAGEDVDEDEDEDEEEEPERPSRYDKDILVNVRAGHRYQIKYDEELTYDTYGYGSYGRDKEYKLDVWVEDVTFKKD